MIISFMRKMAAALAIKPIFEVFSRRCGVSEITDAGIAMESFFLFIELYLDIDVCVVLKSLI